MSMNIKNKKLLNIKPLIIIFLMIFAVSGTYLIFNSRAATTDSTANLWVDTNGGSCTRSANPNTYNDSATCTIDQAYQASSPGDLVLVKGGTYGDMVINDVPAKDGAAWNGTTGIKPVTIRAASGETVTANDLTTHASNLILDVRVFMDFLGHVPYLLRTKDISCILILPSLVTSVQLVADVWP